MAIKDFTTLSKDLRKVQDIIGSKEYLQQAANYVMAAAKLLAPTGESGDLRKSISVTITEAPAELTAHIGSWLEYAIYVEVGTGPKGAANHAGISPDIQPAYTMSPWWVHESQIPPGTGEKYHWYSIETDQGTFYQVTGQPARPFLYPALKDNEQVIGDLLAGSWEKAIRGAT